MSEISGENGAVFWNEELTNTSTSGTVYFNATAKTIISSGGDINFLASRYSTGMLVTVSGCTGEAANNRIFTFSVVTSGQVTVLETVTDSEPEANAVVFTEAEPGIQVGGFYNWTLSLTADALETTNFSGSTGNRTYIPGLKGWTASAEKHFLTTNNVVDSTGRPWWNSTVEIRFFTKYVASPSASDQSQYFRGDTVVTGIDQTTPVDTLVTQSVSLQGDKGIALVTESDAWTS